MFLRISSWEVKGVLLNIYYKKGVDHWFGPAPTLGRVKQTPDVE